MTNSKYPKRTIQKKNQKGEAEQKQNRTHTKFLCELIVLDAGAFLSGKWAWQQLGKQHNDTTINFIRSGEMANKLASHYALCDAKPKDRAEHFTIYDYSVKSNKVEEQSENGARLKAQSRTE